MTAFLAGGGTSGALMRNLDWSATPLGPTAAWPQSLRTSVSTCLNCSFPILIWWGSQLVMLYNDAYATILGDKHPRALGLPGQQVWPEIWDTIGPMLGRVMEHGEATPAEDLPLVLHRHGYPEQCWFSFSYSPIRDEADRVAGVFCPVIETTARVLAERRSAVLLDLERTLNDQLEVRVIAEVAAREQAQARLAQAQRMEALGQLAGGIAHDFNNVLQAVTGGLCLIGRRAGDAEAVRRLARMADDAAKRGATITGRLLAFARKGELQATPVPPGALLDNLREMLAPALGASVQVLTHVAPDVPALLADRAQLETVLVNLAVNARDAMPEGGTLHVTASAEVVAGAHSARLRAGAYVRLDLGDTGVGMTAATLARASEPFFTTKPPGQGTGLGLAMARGFAEQSDGGFALCSAPGQGTTVTLWFPLAKGMANAEVLAETVVIGARGAGSVRVLVVDDDAMVRTVLAEHLADCGYRVTQASDGLDALARLDTGEVADLLVTDFSMPGMNGLVLIQEARQRLPGLPALLLTGYADAGIWPRIKADPNDPIVLLRKPVSGDELAARAAMLLDTHVEAAE